MKKADIGLIGLAVMGENLALNMESKGFTVAVYNRSFPGEEGVVDRFVNGRGKGKNFIPAHSIEELVEAVKRPRVIMMMIKAGAPVDEMIEQLLPHMSPGDVIIDGGNSDFHDTERRYYPRDGKGQRGGAGKSRNAAEKTRILLRSVYEPVCGNRRRGELRRIRLRKKAADLCDPSRFRICARRCRFCARMPFLSYGAADFATLFAFSPRPS